jgi:hypothetical protein
MAVLMSELVQDTLDLGEILAAIDATLKGQGSGSP